MGIHLPAEPGAYASCPDCPAARQDVFSTLVGDTKGACAFQCMTLEPRTPLPDRWFESYGLGLVRRGVLIRQRVDPQGRASAIDAAGPGCVILFKDGVERISSAPSGYAATRLLLCLMPADALDAVLSRQDDCALDVLRLQSEVIERLERITDARGRSGVESRVAALLCALADTLTPPQRRNRIPHGLQQRDMAALLGVRHETVCRVLGNLESRGAVTREADGLTVRDRALLESM